MPVSLTAKSAVGVVTYQPLVPSGADGSSRMVVDGGLPSVLRRIVPVSPTVHPWSMSVKAMA